MIYLIWYVDDSIYTPPGMMALYWNGIGRRIYFRCRSVTTLWVKLLLGRGLQLMGVRCIEIPQRARLLALQLDDQGFLTDKLSLSTDDGLGGAIYS
jgi:hypothetical protein